MEEIRRLRGVEGEGRGGGLGGGDGSTRLILRKSISVDLCKGDPMSFFLLRPHHSFAMRACAYVVAYDAIVLGHFSL